MRCIINVAIGGRYPKEQERLGKSLTKHFDGDFLQWTDFPCAGYSDNPYNAKAAAFEEAIKKGYKQILWLDSPVVALKAVGPIFDSIESNGYLTIKGHANCAQICSDACLDYFKVTRDQAEEFQEHAGGVIGIDMTNAKGKELIEAFIKACKDGAADGSRKHDGQSKDPRFKFHRQCQSVISMCANILGLKPTMKWNGLITLNPNRKTAKTILSWTHRGGHILTENGKTRRISQRGGTRKSKGGYIYLVTIGGLNDTLIHLAKCTEYAIKHHRSIILEMQLYSATDLQKVFDFSKFPVSILTNHRKMQDVLKERPIEPEYYESLSRPVQTQVFIDGKWSTESGQPLEFDFSKSYPANTVLVYAAGGGGEGDSAVNILKHIRLRPAVKKAYEERMAKMPEEYLSIHLRATDRKLNIINNITGFLLKDSDAIIKAPSSGNAHVDSLKKIDAFIEKHPLPVFVSGDNPRLIKRLAAKHPSIIHTVPEDRELGRLHMMGTRDPDNLKNAIVDLLVLASAKAIMTSAGGYSRLAKKLLARPDVMHDLLS
jgi:hypothetical protein